MNEKMKRTLIVGAIATVLYIALGSIISQSISNLLFNNIGMGYEFARFIFAGLRLIEAVIAMIVAIMVNEKAIEKGTNAKMNNKVLSIIVAALVLAVLPLFLGLVRVLWYIIEFVVFALAAYIYANGCAWSSKIQMASNYGGFNNSVGQNPNTVNMPDMSDEDQDELSKAILGAIRPSLKAPMTAVLCNKEDMVIIQNGNEYIVEGYVNSQNSYGAMIATDFTAKLIKQNDQWITVGTQVGVKNAKKYAKNFAANYIVISIFTAVGGLILYFIISMVVGM